MKVTCGILLALCALVGVSHAITCDTNRSRTDCGYVGITQQECQDKGCCWNPVNPNPFNAPWCYFSNGVHKGYMVTGTTDTNTGFNASLAAISSSSSSSSGEDPALGAPVSPVNMAVEYLSDTTLHIKLTDPSNDRYEVPQSVLPRAPATTKAKSPQYDVNVNQNPFGLEVTRTSDGAAIFNSTLDGENTPFNGLSYYNQFLSISTWLYNDNPDGSGPTLYGLEESTRPSGVRIDTSGTTYTLWNHDTPSAEDNTNLYGSHPFYIQLHADGTAHGVLLLNSNGMDVIVNEDYLTYNVIGGVLDFYFFVGPTIGDVVNQYTAVVGAPIMPAAWSLGFHQSRYGYKSVWILEEVVANYSAAGIPLDTIWSDIDHMDAYQDFTFSPTWYPVPDMQSFVSTLHSNDQQYVVILDPGIAINTTYQPYLDLLDGGYIVDCDGNPLAGIVWPGNTIFPDFLSTVAQDYWYDQIKTFLDTVPIDGLWIDMNEISNFENGACPSGSVHPAVANAGNVTNPPYNINNQNGKTPLNSNTISMQGMHNDSGVPMIEYDVHNLYGLTEAIATRNALEKYYNRRSFTLTRSTFVGSGHHVSHWTGDNSSLWVDLWNSIVKMLSFGMLGVPHVGSDICGFNGDTTEELCTRWIQVGAFYPFSRDHSSIGTTNQELYRWPATTQAGIEVLGIRYALFPYYYTLSYEATATGHPIARGQFYEFSTDTNTFGNDRQFLIGSGFMVSPVLEEGATSVDIYFPAATWYDYYNGSLVQQSEVGENVTVSAPLEFVPLHVRGGSIIPRQANGSTIAATMATPYNLLVALDSEGNANGTIFNDDGKSLNTVDNNQYNLVEFTATSGTSITSTVTASGYSPVNNIESITLYGTQGEPSSVTVGGSSATVTYDSSTGAAEITGFSVPLTTALSVSITY